MATITSAPQQAAHNILSNIRGILPVIGAYWANKFQHLNADLNPSQSSPIVFSYYATSVSIHSPQFAPLNGSIDLNATAVEVSNLLKKFAGDKWGFRVRDSWEHLDHHSTFVRVMEIFLYHKRSTDVKDKLFPKLSHIGVVEAIPVDGKTIVTFFKHMGVKDRRLNEGPNRYMEETLDDLPVDETLLHPHTKALYAVQKTVEDSEKCHAVAAKIMENVKALLPTALDRRMRKARAVLEMSPSAQSPIRFTYYASSVQNDSPKFFFNLPSEVDLASSRRYHHHIVTFMQGVGIDLLSQLKTFKDEKGWNSHVYISHIDQGTFASTQLSAMDIYLFEDISANDKVRKWDGHRQVFSALPTEGTEVAGLCPRHLLKSTVLQPDLAASLEAMKI